VQRGMVDPQPFGGRGSAGAGGQEDRGEESKGSESSERHGALALSAVHGRRTSPRERPPPRACHGWRACRPRR